MKIRKIGLIAECLLLVVGVPLLLVAVLPVRYLLPVIWGVTLYCYLIERMRSKGRAICALGMVNWANLRPMLLRFGVIAALMTLLMWRYNPAELFSFVRTKPYFWLLVMVLYPILSVIPQEIIFRSFFFSRYQTLFSRPLVMVLVSGLAFGFAHLVFHNWVAPALCVVGGVMFAQTYQKHRSLALVAIEHALYGDFLFTLGLGRYFYHGAVVVAS